MKIKPTLRLDFCDFNGLDKVRNYFTAVLSREYSVELCDRPELLIYAGSGHMHRLYNCRKIFFTGESLRPDFSQCDYAMTCFYIDDPRHLRLPFYVVRGGYSGKDLVKSPDEVEGIVRAKRKFCSLMVRNANPKRTGRRIEFFHRLSRYKKIDSGGKALNNVGREIPDSPYAKYDFIKEYKFNLCFENKSLEGYTTEKLTDAMWARCIPIYWGNPLVGREFNTRSFLSLHECSGEEEFIDRIIAVDNNEDEYRRMLAEPYFIDNEISEYFNDDRFLGFVDGILTDPSLPVSRRRRFWSLRRWRIAKMMPYTGK